MIPTEPGYYWCQPLNKYVSNVPEIVRVIEIDSGTRKAKFMVEQFGFSRREDIDQFTDWDGPITQEKEHGQGTV